MSASIHIFSAGRRRSTTGEEIDFSAADLAATARAYDPDKHEAPLVIGHPRDDAPAYGWVRTLQNTSADLEAEPHQVDPAFAELVGKGYYKKISASFYRPNAADNPVPGVYYLRHVGFLGAKPPSVKALRAVVGFGDDDQGAVTIEFGEADVGTLRRILRDLREWFIGEHGMETADRIIPNFEIETIERHPPEQAFSEPEHTVTTTTGQPAAAGATADDADLERRRQELDDREAAFAERERKIAEDEAAARRAQARQFVDGLVDSGQVLPRDAGGLAAFVERVEADADAVIEFGEGDGAESKPAAEWLRGFLEHLPPAIDYGEHSSATRRAPAELTSRELAKQARKRVNTAAAEGRTISFTEAVNDVLSANTGDES